MRAEDRDKVVIVARFYDMEGRLTGGGVAGEDYLRQAPHGYFLIEEHLERLGWMRLERHSIVERLRSGHISYSVFICPAFLTRLVPPLERNADGAVCAHPYLC
jgi:hypothetical protein